MNINAMKKLRSKYTGNIGRLVGLSIEDGKYEAAITIDGEDRYRNFYYGTMEQFMKNWEDYEEPKEFWYIGQDGVIFSDVDTITKDYADRLKEIGNYFETKEEAEKAVERLRAWKRLKDKGFRFENYKPYGAGITFTIAHMDELAEDNEKDLKLLFGGEE